MAFIKKRKASLNLNQQLAELLTNVCISLSTTVALNTAENSSDIFLLILQTIITAHMLSNAAEGRKHK